MNRAGDSGYGYLWWLDEWGGLSAHGTRGQSVFVVPRLDLVAVFTANLEDKDFPLPWDYMKTLLFPAIHTDTEMLSTKEDNELTELNLAVISAPNSFRSPIERDLDGRIFRRGKN